jgi:glycosyltransferase involved in cell wall biosynthesis
VEDEAEVCEIQSIFRSNPNITVDAPLGLDWHDEPSIYKIICTFDIGVSPLIDNEFNRGKSAFKLKQCLSCGIPVLASSVGENIAFISHGKNGYFCDTPDEYYERIISLKISEGIFSDLTLNAKNTFPSFSIDEYCSIFLNYFKDEYTVE